LSDKITTLAQARCHTYNQYKHNKGEAGSGLDMALVLLVELVSKASCSSHLTMWSSPVQNQSDLGGLQSPRLWLATLPDASGYQFE
jgi:hypothetical protein